MEATQVSTLLEEIALTRVVSGIEGSLEGAIVMGGSDPPKQVRILNIPGSPNQISAILFARGTHKP